MKTPKQLLLLVFVQLGLALPCFAQKPDIQRINPTNWWVGMKNQNLQILVYGKNISKAKVSLKPYAGVKLLKTQKVENPHYVFIDLDITKAANIRITQ